VEWVGSRDGATFALGPCEGTRYVRYVLLLPRAWEETVIVPKEDRLILEGRSEVISRGTVTGGDFSFWSREGGRE